MSSQNSHVELPATSCAPLVLPPSAHPQHLNRVPAGLDGGWYGHDWGMVLSGWHMARKHG